MKWQLDVVDEGVAWQLVLGTPHDGDEVVCGHLGGDVHPGILAAVEESFDECSFARGVLAHEEQDWLGSDVSITHGRIREDAEESLMLQRQQVLVVGLEELGELLVMAGHLLAAQTTPHRVQ